MIGVNQKFFDFGLLGIKIISGDGASVHNAKNGVERLHPISGRGSTRLPNSKTKESIYRPSLRARH
jgi:hypothetical protein